jgi:hypothetical protein
MSDAISWCVVRQVELRNGGIAELRNCGIALTHPIGFVATNPLRKKRTTHHRGLDTPGKLPPSYSTDSPAPSPQSLVPSPQSLVPSP